ncbi:MAG: hypothetical protein H6737_16505 [Alphaproteobacteria bacterium]|nr:hypothetical protein [Alphaproteobacteria bacterium]
MLFCSFPTLLIRGLVELVLFMVAISFVSKRHPAAGMLIAAAMTMAMLGTFGGPLLECLGYTAAMNSNQQSEQFFVGTMITGWFLWMFGPLTQALNLGLVTIAIALIARDLPEREPETL